MVGLSSVVYSSYGCMKYQSSEYLECEFDVLQYYTEDSIKVQLLLSKGHKESHRITETDSMKTKDANSILENI